MAEQSVREVNLQPDVRYRYFRGEQEQLQQRSLRAVRVDGIVDLNRIDLLDKHESFANLIIEYRENIAECGDDALAHLCLPTKYFHALLRLGFYSLDHLSEFLQVGQLSSIKSRNGQGIGITGERIIRTAYDELMAERAKTPTT